MQLLGRAQHVGSGNLANVLVVLGAGMEMLVAVGVATLSVNVRTAMVVVDVLVVVVEEVGSPLHRRSPSMIAEVGMAVVAFVRAVKVE